MSEHSEKATRITRLGKALLSGGVTALAAVALMSGPAAAAPGHLNATELQRARAACPSGYVCIYPDQGSGGNPATYYRYGSYNLSNVFGNRLVVNNQTGGAGLRLCTSYGGQNCGARLGPGQYVRNLSPINSILLEP
ncbi:hypothetical protein FAF44_26605 [Nonomuraea sp. MG754425]|uniref:peptidase inhibitor family I36 protein n=1 Tax=Nonomuraea sp. MG754425 TaxID=2570319 RepID=UPI001F36CDE3|nr:peptidase inhibitor family I36 protein [Nonomuraea sp. MG754425]MCF6471935.1 hypothetical protein [Nonomuraea sp. MG754425]